MEELYGEENQAEAIPPIIIDLGKTTRERVKQLSRGQGRLMRDVMVVISQVQEELGVAREDKELVPVVVIYKKKRKKRRRALWLSL